MTNMEKKDAKDVFRMAVWRKPSAALYLDNVKLSSKSASNKDV